MSRRKAPALPWQHPPGVTRGGSVSLLYTLLPVMLPLPFALLQSRSRRFLSGLLLLGAALLLAPAPAQAQVEHFGLKAGVTSMTGDGEGLLNEELGRRTGFTVGGTVQVGIAGRFSLRPELLFVRKGWTASGRTRAGESITTTVTLDYLELPVLADVRVVSVGRVSVHAVAGPTVGLRVRSGASVEGADIPDGDPGETLDRAEVGLAAGLGASAKVGGPTVRLGVRYRRGLFNINDRPEQTPDGERGSPPFIRNQGVSVAVGVAF